MAEVGPRLNGVCRLSALRKGRNRPACAGKAARSVPGSIAFTADSWLRAESAADIRRCPRRHGARQEPLEKVCRGRENEDGSSCCFTCMDSDCCFPDRAVESREWPLPVRRERGTYVTFDQRAEPGSKRFRRRLLTVCPDALWSSITVRYYSEDSPLLYRSRTGYYDLLSVTPAATQAQIKTAYYKQSLIYHPDKNPGNKEATQRFSEISEAYTVLGNAELRRQYDRGLLSQSQVNNAGRPSGKPASSTKRHQHGERRFTQSREKTMFDFDAFYQGHYGEQLQREQLMRARRRYYEEQQKKKYKKQMEDAMRATAVVLLGLAGSLLLMLSRT